MKISKDLGDIYYMIAIALHTGIRRGELLQLQWDDFDFKRNVLMVRKSKTGKFRAIPFNSKIKEHLNPILSKSGRLFDYTAIPQRQWRKLCKKTNVSIRWHDLRHTYGSNLVMDGVPLRVVADLMGHAQISTTMIYSHLSEDHKKQAVKTVDY